jgi:membrane-associated PAP2 superfamily phosphatase
MHSFAVAAPIRAPLLATGVALAGVLAWDAAGLDLLVAHVAGGRDGFPLKDSWLLSVVLHEAARRAAWLGLVALCLSVWWPWAGLRSVPRSRRLQWAGSALLAAGVVTLLKAASLTSCPWDLQDFGGVAHHLSHWSRTADGGPGRCFPAGHASAGFGFIGGYFALRRTHPRAARRVLAASVTAGFVLGLSQQWRGAHFMSHTLWTGWVCWVTALALDMLVGIDHPGGADASGMRDSGHA